MPQQFCQWPCSMSQACVPKGAAFAEGSMESEAGKKPMGRAELGHSWTRNWDVHMSVMFVVIKVGHRE